MLSVTDTTVAPKESDENQGVESDEDALQMLVQDREKEIIMYSLTVQ